MQISEITEILEYVDTRCMLCTVLIPEWVTVLRYCDTLDTIKRPHEASQHQVQYRQNVCIHS